MGQSAYTFMSPFSQWIHGHLTRRGFFAADLGMKVVENREHLGQCDSFSLALLILAHCSLTGAWAPRKDMGIPNRFWEGCWVLQGGTMLSNMFYLSASGLFL